MIVKQLDWYFFRRFISAYFFVVLLLTAVICIIDYAEKYQNFVNHDLSAQEILLDYYLNFIPYITNMLSPITIFIATVFITAKLASHSEIIAALAGGISFGRLLKPYIIGAVLIAGLIFGLTGWVIPKANKTRVAFERAYVRSPFYFDKQNIHIKIGPESYIYMQNYDNQNDVGRNFTLEKIVGTELKEKLKASKIEWVPETEKWRISDYTKRTFDGMNETISEGSTIDTMLNLHPDDFQDKHLHNETLTLNELNAQIAEMRERGTEGVEVYLVDKYERFTYPFSILILTIIGVIAAAPKTRGGPGLRIAFGFFMAFVYLIFVMVSRSIAKAGTVEPLLAVWVPNIVFSIIGFVMYKRVPK